MAEALFRRAAGDRHEARSAGSSPAAAVHPEVAALMPELADRVPHKLERADAEWADVVVTMGCGDACPYIPGKRYVDWELDDPPQERAAKRRGGSGTRSSAASPRSSTSWPSPREDSRADAGRG